MSDLSNTGLAPDPNMLINLDAPAQFTVQDYLSMVQNFNSLTIAMQQQQQAFAQHQQVQEAAMQLITNHLAAIPTTLSQPTIPSVPTLTPSLNVKPMFNLPKEFKGKATEVESFLDTINNTVELQCTSLTVECDKSLYMATFLGEGSPRQWLCGVKISNLTLIENFAQFKDAF
ncbi:hypothetical protein GYMLUDRAFT_55626 [Collybiopsis luxurians FD-317 M1]|nr:hypothetical protein GYMLUDRAFT_55626 [Collybiopsis luxurians FD-317 M1]